MSKYSDLLYQGFIRVVGLSGKNFDFIKYKGIYVKHFEIICAIVIVISFSSNIVLAAGKPETNDDSAAQITTLFKQAVAKVNRGEYSKALVDFEKIVRDEPRNADAHNYIGFCYRKSGQLKDAQAAYNRVFAINPEHRGALEYQGELFLKLGDLQSAKRNLEKLIKICGKECKESSELQRAISGFMASS